MAFSPTSVGGRNFTLEWNKETLKQINKIGDKAFAEIADTARDEIKARAPVAAQHKDARGVKGPLKQSIEARMLRRTMGSMIMMHYYGFFLHKGTKYITTRNNFVDRGVAAMEARLDEILAKAWTG